MLWNVECCLTKVTIHVLFPCQECKVMPLWEDGTDTTSGPSELSEDLGLLSNSLKLFVMQWRSNVRIDGVRQSRRVVM